MERERGQREREKEREENLFSRTENGHYFYSDNLDLPSFQTMTVFVSFSDALFGVVCTRKIFVIYFDCLRNTVIRPI